MSYQLLDRFQSSFENGPYRHRSSTLGDSIALRLYEDLLQISRSKAYASRVEKGLSVVNAQNARFGVRARRGDGSFGEIVPNVEPLHEDGFKVMRGPIATIEIGIEVKILAKAMIKQIDRVINDLTGQVTHFKSKGGRPICVGVVGINNAPFAIGYEGDRMYPTDGKANRHPAQEAAEAERRLMEHAAPAFDEFLILHYVATNEANPTFDFRWKDERATTLGYGAVLARISQRYEQLYAGA